MQKNDFWVLSLVAFFIIAVLTQWNPFLKVVVILNSLLVLWQVVARLMKEGQKRG